MKINIKRAIRTWNEKNPTLRKKTIKILAEEIGVPENYIYSISRYRKRVGKFEITIENWNEYLNLNITLFNRLELIRKVLECEIWELWEHSKK